MKHKRLLNFILSGLVFLSFSLSVAMNNFMLNLVLKVSAATSADFSISQNGVEFICAREGFSQYCYYDGNQSSIGYGTKCGTSAHASGLHTITKEAAMAAMMNEINNQYAPNVRRQTSGITMNQNQFDALVSFTYNTGGGTTMIKNSPLVKYLRGELTESEARSKFSNYVVTNSATNKVDQGLINRRKAEANLFFSLTESSSPTYSILSSDKKTIALDEEITFYASSDYATGYTIGIDNSEGRYITQEMPNGRLSLKFSEPGSYGAYVTSYNTAGYCDSAWIGFTVYDTKPSTSKLTSDKAIVSIGEEITFTASSEDAVKGFTIGIDNSERRYITQEMTDGKLTLTFNEPGNYGAYVTAYNDYGYSDSAWINFTVYNSKPSASELFVDKTLVYVGQDVTFNAVSDVASGYTIGVDNDNERLVTQEMTNGMLTLSFDKPGNYSAYVTSYNSFGYKDSKRVHFTVYNTAPTFSLLESSVNKALINEPISFFASSDLAIEYLIGINFNGERYMTKIMPDGYLLCSFDQPGVYTAYVTSSNGYGYVDSKKITFNIYNSKEEMILKGDCNDDGEFTVADIVMLQRWLLNDGTKLESWQAADLCEDGVINIFDLLIMKRKLVYG